VTTGAGSSSESDGSTRVDGEAVILVLDIGASDSDTS